MGYRSFTCSKGIAWQAWDVIPALADRRIEQRRARRMAMALERRANVDRRVGVGTRPLLSKGLDGGWLCFDSLIEKRRLAPIPSDWLRCAVARLEEYLRKARPAARSAGSIPAPDLSHFQRGSG